MTVDNTQINLFNTSTRDVWFGLSGHLGIIVSPDALSFYLFNESTSELVGHTELALPQLFKGGFMELSHALASLPLLKNQFKKVSVVVNSLSSTIIPASLYDVSKKKELFSFNCPLHEKDLILTDKITSQEAVLLYSLKKDLHDYLVIFFPNVTFKHLSGLLIDFVPEAAANEKLIFNMNDGLLSIAVLKNNKLVFSNNFSTQTNEDVAYYVFFTMEQLEINHKTAQLFSAGQITSELENLITPYVQNFCKVSAVYNLKGVEPLLGKDIHAHFTALTLTQCE